MDKILQRLIDRNFAGLDGLTIDASIPLTEQLANEIIASALQAYPVVDYCRVKIQRENRITCDVKSPRWPWPFNVKLRLFGSVDFTGSPTLRAFLGNNLLLGKLGSLFNVLPDEISIFEDQVSVDLGIFIRSQEQKALLALIQTIGIRTEEGRLFFDIKIRK